MTRSLHPRLTLLNGPDDKDLIKITCQRGLSGRWVFKEWSKDVSFIEVRTKTKV